MRLPDGVCTKGLAEVTVELVEVMTGEGVDGLCLDPGGDSLCHHLVDLDRALAAPDPPAVLDVGGQHFTDCPDLILGLGLFRLDGKDEFLQFGGGLAFPSVVPVGDPDHSAPLP